MIKVFVSVRRNLECLPLVKICLNISTITLAVLSLIGITYACFDLLKCFVNYFSVFALSLNRLCLINSDGWFKNFRFGLCCLAEEKTSAYNPKRWFVLLAAFCCCSETDDCGCCCVIRYFSNELFLIENIFIF